MSAHPHPNPALDIERHAALVLEQLLDTDVFSIGFWFGILTVHQGGHDTRPVATLTRNGVEYRNHEAHELMKSYSRALVRASGELDKTRSAWFTGEVLSDEILEKLGV